MKTTHYSSSLGRRWRGVLTLTFATASLTATTLAQTPASSTAPAKPGVATNASAASAFKGDLDKLSYALGVNAAGLLLKNAIEVNPDLYSQGLRDALSGRPLLLSAREARAIVGAAQREVAEKQRAEKSRPTRELAAKNKAEGEAFLAANKTKDGVVTLPGGVQYKIVKGGEGPKPTLEDTIVCHYRGTLVDGSEVESTARRGQPATLPLRKLMKGWREVVPLMAVGSKWEFAVPASLAYGARGAGRAVGPNSTLRFELELLAIKSKPAAPEPAAAGEELDDEKESGLEMTGPILDRPAPEMSIGAHRP